MSAVYAHVRRSGLARRIIDLAFLRVSQINGCAYCIDQDSRDLLAGGVTVDHRVLTAVWREAGEVFETAPAVARARL